MANPFSDPYSMCNNKYYLDYYNYKIIPAYLELTYKLCKWVIPVTVQMIMIGNKKKL